jgi:hypothetical protein
MEETQMIDVPHASSLLHERHGPPDGLTPERDAQLAVLIPERAAMSTLNVTPLSGRPCARTSTVPRMRKSMVLTGARLGDVRHEPVGGFAGPVAPNAPVGTYGDRQVPRRHGAGGFAGDPDRQRQGSFADTDRVVITTYQGDAERARVSGLRAARRLLGRASLDDNTVDRAIHELNRGHAVVLVDVSESVASDAPAQLEWDARAA